MLLAPLAWVSRPKRFVYILKSVAYPDEYYVGVTSDMTARITAHNEGLTPSTVDHRPWRAVVVIEFDEESPALAFERYLKTGSGREFARRHFRQTVTRARRVESAVHPTRQSGQPSAKIDRLR